MNHYKGVTAYESVVASLRQVAYDARENIIRLFTESLCVAGSKRDTLLRSPLPTWKLGFEINVRVLCTQLKVSSWLNFGAVSNTRAESFTRCHNRGRLDG